MGTRGLTCVYKDEEYKVAQYGQWDHYPSGQGVTILSFLRGELINEGENDKPYKVKNVIYDKKAFTNAIDNCYYASDEEIGKAWDEAGAEGKDSITFEVSAKMQHIHPQYARDMGAMVLPYIQKTGGIGLKNNINFSGDSLFCEWSYVIDYDKNVLEVYKGFVKEPHEGRFAKYFCKKDYRDENQYYPVALLKSWDLDNLPTSDEFIAGLTLID